MNKVAKSAITFSQNNQGEYKYLGKGAVTHSFGNGVRNYRGDVIRHLCSERRFFAVFSYNKIKNFLTIDS